MQVEAGKEELDRAGVEPFYYTRRLIRLETGKQRSGVALHHDHGAVHLTHELLGDRVIQKREQWIEITGDIEQSTRLRVHPELAPRPGLKEFLERPDPAGQRNEPVRQLGHHRLSRMH